MALEYILYMQCLQYNFWNDSSSNSSQMCLALLHHSITSLTHFSLLELYIPSITRKVLNYRYLHVSLSSLQVNGPQSTDVWRCSELIVTRVWKDSHYQSDDSFPSSWICSCALLDVYDSISLVLLYICILASWGALWFIQERCMIGWKGIEKKKQGNIHRWNKGGSPRCMKNFVKFKIDKDSSINSYLYLI